MCGKRFFQFLTFLILGVLVAPVGSVEIFDSQSVAGDFDSYINCTVVLLFL